MLSSSRDNWERLVAAVVKREEIWQLCHQDSFTTISSNSQRPSNSSEEIISIWRNSLKSNSVSPQHQAQLASDSGIEARKNASGPFTRRLFSALPWRRKPKDYALGQNLVGISEDHFGLQSFSLHELLAATDNFSQKNVLGRGGFSTVYKGRLADGSLVAVKRLLQQVIGIELEITSIAAHCNVLRARGFCITEKEQMLVYPYMANGSVASCLRESAESQPPLNWQVRKCVALGAAKGLAYLHYECPRKVLHRDVKAANILLDENFEAVVVKTDVYGYGVFLLELITAEKSYDLARGANDSDVVLLNMVKGSYKEGKWKTVIDAGLKRYLVDGEVEELLQIALICTHTDPELRPTMLEAVMMLEIGHGLSERWEECKKDFTDENFEAGHLRRFTIHEVMAATEYFSNKIISKDGFNMIYTGCLDGSPVAVKRYNSQSLEYWFKKELDIGRICLHPNLVHVIGFCHTPEERLLVFRLMVNGSVESWLRGRDESRPPLTWRKRKNIALGAARGLAYLHNKCKRKIIHRDVKASTVYLDDNFEPVVADFKLAKFMDCNRTHITTTVAGTKGHIAPEYLASGKCSDKSDVFGYGAFLLELITGQRTIDLLDIADDEDMMCADWVKRNYEDRRWKTMVDKDGGDDSMEAVVKQLVNIAVLCTQYNPDKRPRMLDAVRMLEAGGGSAEWSEEEVRKEEDPLNNYPNSEWIGGNDISSSGLNELLSGPR
ncbi:protein kinase superfamily, variant 2 [Salvia divinorum]|uniref:non-specific serine/threonine protein kinase n=1 Tax=Salvia divinorum TaxID=28513 RepID=A0ABD1FUM7_SALDI